MCILQVSTLADHAHVGTCTSAVDLVHELCHSLANTDSELEPSVRHFSALVGEAVNNDDVRCLCNTLARACIVGLYVYTKPCTAMAVAAVPMTPAL